MFSNRNVGLISIGRCGCIVLTNPFSNIPINLFGYLVEFEKKKQNNQHFSNIGNIVRTDTTITSDKKENLNSYKLKNRPRFYVYPLVKNKQGLIVLP